MEQVSSDGTPLVELSMVEPVKNCPFLVSKCLSFVFNDSRCGKMDMDYKHMCVFRICVLLLLLMMMIMMLLLLLLCFPCGGGDVHTHTHTHRHTQTQTHTQRDREMGCDGCNCGTIPIYVRLQLRTFNIRVSTK